MANTLSQKSLSISLTALVVYTERTSDSLLINFFVRNNMISLGNPYLKILDLSKLFDADAHVKEIKKWFYSTSEHFVLRGGEIAHLLEGL